MSEPEKGWVELFGIDPDYPLEDRAWEYTIVYDGVPRMDGTHQRCQMGSFHSLEEAKTAFEGAVIRSVRAPYPSLRIERRLVGPWEIVDE